MPRHGSQATSRWTAWLDRPLSGWWCALWWCVATAVFVGIVVILGGPARGDFQESVLSAWAIAHGQFSCAFPSGRGAVPGPSPFAAPVTAPLYPLVTGGISALARIGHGVPFPSAAGLGPGCDNAFRAINGWSVKAGAVAPTVRLGYGAWLVLMAGVIAVLRACGRGRRRWEPATLLVVACLPPVWMCLENFFHPQDLVALGFALAAVAGARRGAWIWAGVLVALAALSQQFALLVAVPLLVIAPTGRRLRFAGATLAAFAVAALPLLTATSSSAARATLLGSGNTQTGDGGTVVWELHLHGWALLLLSRVAPIVLSALLAWWVLRRLGRAALDPPMLMSLVSVSLCLRLVFEQNFYGYYFAALAVSLVLLDVVSGHVRGSVVAWMVVMSLVFCFGPTSSYSVLDHVSWAAGADRYVPLVVIVLALVLLLVGVVGRRPLLSLVLCLAVALGAVASWPIPQDHLSPHLQTWFWQVWLVLSGLVLAASPILALLGRQHEQVHRADTQHAMAQRSGDLDRTGREATAPNSTR